MIMKDDQMVNEIRALLEGQHLSVLATQGDGQPYTSLMAYSFTEDLRFILLATAMSTRKHRNIIGESRVALLVDDRSNNEEDLEKAAALTIIGEACDVETDEIDYYYDLYLERHPSLKSFLASSSTVFFKVKVQKYLLVSRFEEVVEYQVGDKSNF